MRGLVAIIVALAFARVADADPHARAFKGKKFAANKRFGLGIELGEPTAITGKYFYASDKAIDFGVGDVYDYSGYRGVTFYADHLWHPFVLASTDTFELPFYIGVGGRFWNFDDYNYRGGADGDALGVRVPIGVAFDLNNVPFDIFIQVVPTLDLFFDTPTDYGRTLYLQLDGSVGIRFWFS